MAAPRSGHYQDRRPGGHQRHQRRGRPAVFPLALAVSGAAVPRIFEIVGIDRVLPRFPSVAEALAHIPAAETSGPPPT